VPHFGSIVIHGLRKPVLGVRMRQWPRAAGNYVAHAFVFALTLFLTAMLSQSALARGHHHVISGSHVRPHAIRRAWRPIRLPWHTAAARPFGGSPTDPAKDAELVLDGRTGHVLFARNADAQRHPASLTKMMTLYMLFDALKRGQVTLNSPVYVSQHAAWQAPTKLGLRPGDWLPVDMAIRAAVVLSANDIAVAIAEALGGTESHFAELMTQKARELGMRNTFYHNASGLPDNRQITTAADLGILARHLAYDFPQYFHYFSLPGFAFRGRVHLGHDNLLGRYAGADGIKTGYTNASGFNLVSSVVRNGAHVIGIVMGGYSAHRRDVEMMRLLDSVFAQINAQPTLVARAEVPWQSLAEGTNALPVIAGFQFGSSAPASRAGMQSYAAIAPRGEMDEDSAESRGDDDEIAKIITTAPPKPQIGAPPRQVGVAVISSSAQVRFPAEKAPGPTSPPNVSPMPRDNDAPVSALAQSLPLVMPQPRSDATILADVRPSTLKAITAPGGSAAAKMSKSASRGLYEHSWTIQIGAFGDVPTARAQLAAYAERSMDMLGQADRIIVPFTSTDGKTHFRARFGTFAEQQARSICARLLERRQTCFPATLAR